LPPKVDQQPKLISAFLCSLLGLSSRLHRKKSFVLLSLPKPGDLQVIFYDFGMRKSFENIVNVPVNNLSKQKPLGSYVWEFGCRHICLISVVCFVRLAYT
jgi:hypothetical protein